MKFYKDLYVGKKIAEDKRKVIHNIKHHKCQCNVYVITLARNPYDMLDIYNANVLCQPFYKKRDKEMMIIGLARGRREALRLIESIVMDVYHKTGDCKVKEYVMKS